MSILAIVGVGRWGRNYIKSIEKIPDVRLKYLCATKKKSLAKFTNNYIKVCDYRNLLEFKDINGIIIATPSNTHFELTRYFLLRGYNLLIEKPLTTSQKDAEKLKKIYQDQETKQIVMTGHIFLYNSAYLKFKELIPEIGKIQYLDFEGCDFGPFLKDSSVLWEWAPHDVSMCLDLLQEFPLFISAWIVDQDMVYARLKFKKTQVFMKFGWLSPVKKRKITIVGSKRFIIFDDTKDKKVIVYEKIGPRSQRQYPKYSKEEPLVSEVKEFINCLEKKRQPRTDMEHSLLVAKVIELMQESIEQNGKMINTGKFL